MPIATGIKPYIDLDREFGDWRDDFARDGYAVIKAAIPAERAEQYRQRGFDWIEKWGLGFKRDDPSTWTKDHIPVVRKGGQWHVQSVMMWSGLTKTGMFHHSIGHEAFLWDIRQYVPIVHADKRLQLTRVESLEFSKHSRRFGVRMSFWSALTVPIYQCPVKCKIQVSRPGITLTKTPTDVAAFVYKVW